MSRQHYRREELLTQRETFERYERPGSQNFNPSVQQYRLPDHGQLACEYRQPPPQPAPRSTSHTQKQLASQRPYDQTLSCEYRAAPVDEYRHEQRFDLEPQVMNPKGPTTIRTYFPSTRERKIPLGLIISIAIAVPILIIVILFGAVWLQELGVL